MSPNLVRRLQRNSRGELEEVGLVEAPAGEDGFVGDPLAPIMQPNGLLAPRFRRYRPQIAPPPVSRQYRADPTYAAGGTLAVQGDTIRQADANQRAWHNHYSDATNRIHAWLAGQGLLGPDTKTAYEVRQHAAQAKTEARAAVVAAKEAVTAAENRLVDAINAYVEGKGSLPDGLQVIAAKQKVTAVEMAVDLVDRAASEAQHRYGRGLVGADWAAALHHTEQVRGDQAAEAAAWLRVKLNPPPSSSADPIGWAGI